MDINFHAYTILILPKDDARSQRKLTYKEIKTTNNFIREQGLEATNVACNNHK
jgi:hypothetical protein